MTLGGLPSSVWGCCSGMTTQESNSGLLHTSMCSDLWGFSSVSELSVGQCKGETQSLSSAQLARQVLYHWALQCSHLLCLWIGPTSSFFNLATFFGCLLSVFPSHLCSLLPFHSQTFVCFRAWTHCQQCLEAMQHHGIDKTSLSTRKAYNRSFQASTRPSLRFVI